MSSSSTTACSRSPSPSPATPESTDGLDPVLNQEHLSAWCNSLSPSSYLGDESRLSESSKTDIPQILELEDLLQDGVFQNVNAPLPEGHAVADPRSLSKPPLSSAFDSNNLLSRTHATVSPTKPVPPPPSQPRPDPSLTSQRVVYPLKEGCYNLPIMIPSIPEGGTKSRVETQVRLTIDLAHASASSGEPLKYDRVGSWKWLRLPRGTSTKKRTRKEGKADAPPEDTLYLTAEVTCSSAPHTRVTCCSSCQAREAKRVARKIAARVRPARSDTESPDEAPFIPGKGKHEDGSNIVQFNCPEVLDFSAGSVVLPLRITCYCRHHRERVGFNVHFKMLDYAGRIVGTGITRPIMITDDHKTTGANAQKTVHSNYNGEAMQSPEWSLGAISESQDAAVSAKRKKTRNDHGSERTKKRTKPYDIGQSGRTVRRDSSGSVDSPSNTVSVVGTRSSSPLHSFLQSPTSPFNSVVPESSHTLDNATPQGIPDALSSAFDFSSPIADHQMSQANFDTDITMAQQFDPDVMSLQQLANSYLPTSPSSPMPMSLNPAHTLNVPTAHAPFILFGQNPPPPIPDLPLPKIHRLIPASGPTYGGIEVTVLGSNFHPSMQLTCTFGGTPASSTQRWSDNTLVCVLPPSANPGVVTVWFEGIQKEEDGTPPCIFTYTDETDKALMELALQVVGLKMTGKIEDARNVAMRIVGNTEPSDGSGMGTSGAMQLATAAGASLDFRCLLLSRADNNGDFETVLIDFLSLLDVSMDRPTLSLSASISHQTASGHTLLHLATMAKFPALVDFLIGHEVDIDARDKNGCTALFLAAVVRCWECARVLVRAGAALDIVNASGKTPVEAAPAEFFDFVSFDSTSSERDYKTNDEDEAALGDAEDDSDDEAESRSLARRHADRKSTLRKRRSAHGLSKLEQNSQQHPSNRSSDSKKGLDSSLPDEKQVASFMETLSRTLAQWQHPQDVIANMPNLPLPHLPHIPGMPAWNALPQMPAVFPVLVPIPALSALWGDRRTGEGQTRGEEKNVNAQPWLAMPTSQDWRAFWEKWMTQATLPSRQSEDTSDAPPAYSPRNSDVADTATSSKEKTILPSGSVILQPPVVDQSVSRHIEYQSLPLPEDEVKAYAYRPRHRPSRDQKKHDRMLVLFWIPILLIGAIWAFVHFMRVAFHATRAVLTIKAGLKV